MKITGSCLCGSVRYSCSAEPIFSGNCHCKDCQKSTGSGYVPVLFVPEEAVSIQGEVKFYESTGDSGGKVLRGFCPNCGSPLFGKPEIMAGLIGLRAGTLDNTSQYHPNVDIYVSRAAPWDYIAPTATVFADAPTQPDA